MWDDFAEYMIDRATLGGLLYRRCTHRAMRRYIRAALPKAEERSRDVAVQEAKWARTYQNSFRSRFYAEMRRRLDDLSYDSVLEHGCSIGLVLRRAAENASICIGIDSSFYAVSHASRSARSNTEYIVADSLRHPLGEQKFDLVMALNILEIVEPADLLGVMVPQARHLMVLSDPYDYEGMNRKTRQQLDGKLLRDMIQGTGFLPVGDTVSEGYIPWSLTINDRTKLTYRVDLVIAKRA